MKRNYCSHPNCKSLATKQRSGDNNKWLCEIHYNEIINTAKAPFKPIILTCPGDK